LKHKVHVTCKCPECHVLHVETQGWGYKPAVTPWRYCKQECGMTKKSPGAQRSGAFALLADFGDP